MKRVTLTLALVLAVLASGCMQGNTEEKANGGPAVKGPATQPTIETVSDYNVDDAQLPLIEENDTVEIGQMI